MRSITRTIWTLMIGAVTLLSTPARAEEGESPRAMMNIDRSQPGFSSRTVERGHVQAELGASYRVNKSFASRGFPPPNQPPPTTSERLMGLVVRGRVGLPAQLELSLSAELFGWQRSITPSGRDTFDRGQSTVGLRWHAMDGGGAVPSLGLMLQSVLLPTTDRFPEVHQDTWTRLHVLTDWALPASLTLRVNLAWGARHEMGGWRLDRQALLSAALGVPITASWRAFVGMAWYINEPDRLGNAFPRPSLHAQWQVTDTLALDVSLTRDFGAHAFREHDELGGSLGLSARW